MTPALIAYKERPDTPDTNSFAGTCAIGGLLIQQTTTAWELVIQLSIKVHSMVPQWAGVIGLLLPSQFACYSYEPWVKPCISPRVHFGELSHLQANHGIMVNDADVVCQIAIDFQAHIESLKTIAHCRWVCSNVSSLCVHEQCVGTIGLHLFGRCSVNISTSSVTCIS